MSDNAKSGVIFNIQKFSTEDGPGIRTTVFMKGCPLRCPWCHNPESISPKPQLVWHSVKCIGDGACIELCPEKAISRTDSGITIDRNQCVACGTCALECPANALEILGKPMTVAEIMDEVLKDTKYYQKSNGGVTFSGGEPALQKEFLSELLAASREQGLHTALDTCGQMKRETLEMFLCSVDLVLYDLKTLDGDLLKQTTGGNLELILNNLRYIDSQGVPTWVRVPVIPGYTDSPENVASIAGFVAAELGNVERFDLLAFSNLCTSKYEQLDMEFVLQGAALFSEREMQSLREAAINAGVENAIVSGPMRKE